MPGIDAGDSQVSVRFLKGAHQWTFTCSAEEEQSLLFALIDLAEDSSVPLDWLDVAAIAHELERAAHAPEFDSVRTVS